MYARLRKTLFSGISALYRDSSRNFDLVMRTIKMIPEKIALYHKYGTIIDIGRTKSANQSLRNFRAN